MDDGLDDQWKPVIRILTSRCLSHPAKYSTGGSEKVYMICSSRRVPKKCTLPPNGIAHAITNEITTAKAKNNRMSHMGESPEALSRAIRNVHGILTNTKPYMRKARPTVSLFSLHPYDVLQISKACSAECFQCSHSLGHNIRSRF